jgi:hypothetical protein
VKTLAALGAIALVVVAVFATVEGAFALLVGWIAFLIRVVPQVTPDGPTTIVGLAAILVFAIGVHWAGRSWRGRSGETGRRWTIRATASVVLGVVVLFAAGIALVGIVHQAGWLAADDAPLQGEGLAKRGDSRSTLFMIKLAVSNYHDTNNQFPPGGSFAADGAMLHSWETHILPFVGYSPGGVDMNQAWNAPPNQKYFQCVLPEFTNPSFRTPPLTDADGYGLSHYSANSRVLGPNFGLRLADITDGPANTILLGEVNAGFKPWGHPVNWRDPAAGIGGTARGFGGPPGAGGARFLMADMSVRFVSDQVSPEVLRALATPTGGESFDATELPMTK